MNIPVPDNGIPIQPGDPSYVYKGVYHPITWINNLPYRPRVETLVIKDGTMVYLRLKNTPGTIGNYDIPGGSIDADSTKIQQAENETNEESLISVKDIYDAGIQYYEDYPSGFIMNGGDTPLEYKGHISDVFVSQYSGIYDINSVEKKDLDPNIANNGKFYRIIDVAKILRKEHCDAILNCPYVNSTVKASLRILSQMVNSMNKTNLKDISSSEITDTLIIVSPYDKLVNTIAAPAGKERNWKKLPVFRSIKNAVEDFFIICNGKPLRHNKTTKILYVYTIDNSYKEVSLYTPTNEESPCGKVTGELWLKSSVTNVPIKRLGMIQVTSTGKSNQFYGGIHNSNVYTVPEYTFKWIIKDMVQGTVVESTPPIVPGNKLYHGTTYEIKKFEPLSLNLGNAMEEPGWVTFAFADYTLALRFGLMRAIQKAKDYWGKDIFCSWNLSESKPYISAEDFNKVNDLIQGFRFFVYTIDASNLNVGIGNDDRLQEYTFSESNIIPEKEDVLKIDSNLLRGNLIIVPDSEFDEYKKNQETMAKYEHPRGWYGAFITRDYDNGDASHQLRSACSNGYLKPGDDIQEYMNSHGISFNDDSVNMSPTIESTFMKSTLSANFKKRSYRKLSSFKKLRINQSVVNKYKHKTKALQNMEPTEEGYVFTDGEEFVAVVVVDTGRDGTGDLKDYNWITYIEVDKKYQGCGLSRQLLDIAVKELKGDFLTVTYDNEVAINLYKSYGFKISKYSYDEVKSGKSKSQMYTMFYKNHHPKDVEFVSESYVPVTENLLISKEIFGVNFEDFVSGKSNIILITGLSGSGKSTLGDKIANEYGAELIELDCFECCYQFENDEQLREAGEVFYQYLSAHRSLWTKLKKRSIGGKELGKEIDKFIQFVIPWCKRDTKTKYVIEGVQIYSFLNKEKISGIPLLITGTSALKSLVRRFNRTYNDWGKEALKDEFRELPQCIAWYIDNNGQLEKFKKSVLESAANDENTLMSYSKNKNHVIEIINSLPLYEKKFIGNHVGERFADQFVSHTKNLKYREVLLINNEPVAFLDVYTMPDMDDTEGTVVLATKYGTNYRRKGYGTILVDRMENCITGQTGITKLIWEYDKKNIKSSMMGITCGYKGSNQKYSKTLEHTEREIYVSEAAEYSSTNKYPVFITLMHTGTPTATFIKKMTRDEFSHATISFNVRLSPQYSFGTKKLGGKERGLVIHGTRDPFYDHFKTTYATYVMYVSKQQREKMLTRLQWFVDHEETLKYDTLALGACFLHIPTEFRKKYFCSRFVMEIIGEGQVLSKVPSLWKPQEIAHLNNITLVNAGDDFRHYDHKVTTTNLNLIKENRHSEIYVDMPISESIGEYPRSELPNDIFGLPEHRKYPLDTEKHVKSAIKFFNYVKPEDEEELAQNILKRMDDLEMDSPAVSRRNRFIKYIQESYNQIKYNAKNHIDWSLINTLDGDERKIALKTAASYANSPIVYTNNTFIGKELAGTINIFRDHNKEDLSHIFVIANPKFVDSYSIHRDLIDEASLELSDPIYGISTHVIDYPNDPGLYMNPKSGSTVMESCKDVKTAREFLKKVDKLGEKYNANFFIVTDGASMTRNNKGGNPAVQHCRNAQKEWERANGFDPDEDWVKDRVLESKELYGENYKEVAVFEEAEYSEKNRYPVFILLSQSSQDHANYISRVTKDDYSHIDIAFDPQLSHLYSFSSYGADIETRSCRHEVYKRDKTAYSLYVMYVTSEQYIKIVNNIKHIEDNNESFSYDWGALRSLMKGVVPKSTQNKYVCSSFVANVLGKDNLLQKSPEMWHPQKMVASFTNMSLVNMGDDLSKYDSSKTKRNLELVKRKEYSSIVLENKLDLGLLNANETWTPLMEAPKIIDKDSTGDSTNDYTSDIEDPTNSENEEVDSTPDSTEDNEVSDYTNDVQEPEDDDNKANDDDQTDDVDNMDIDEPTDYTSDSNDDSENTDDMTADSSNDDNTDENGNLFDNNVLKNYSLLKNFEKLYELIKEVSDTLDAKVEPTKLQNIVLAQVLKNLNSIKEFIISYVKFQFSQDNYPQNRYYYNIVVQSLKLNLELLKRNHLLSDNK